LLLTFIGLRLNAIQIYQIIEEYLSYLTKRAARLVQEADLPAVTRFW